MSMFALAAFALLAAAQPQAGACADALSQSEMNVCAAEDFARADSELNAEYRRAVAWARDDDREERVAGDDRPGDEATLRAAQRAWVAFRDAHCRLEGYGERGGSMEPMVYEMCRARLTRERTAQLRPRPAPDQ
jgi:uncharacterized protein YecT (DUF1311 family)